MSPGLLAQTHLRCANRGLCWFSWQVVNGAPVGSLWLVQLGSPGVRGIFRSSPLVVYHVISRVYRCTVKPHLMSLIGS